MMGIKNDLLKTITSMTDDQIEKVADIAFDNKYKGSDKCDGADLILQYLQGQIDFCELKDGL